MLTHRPIVAALGACLLQACMTTPPAKEEAAVLTAPTTAQAPTQMAIQPVMRVRHSADQTAATYYQLGKYHLERGNFDFARSAYEASIMLDSRQLDARNALAALDATQGKLESAKLLLLQIVADFPEVAHPYNNLGYVYFLQSNFEAAERTLQRAIALDAGNERARNNLNAVNMALARLGSRETVALSMTVSTPILTSSTLPIPVADIPTATPDQTRTQSLAIISPAPEPRIDHDTPKTRMEVVEVVPNIFELKLKHAIDTVLADLNIEKKTAIESPLTASLAMTRTLPVALPIETAQTAAASPVTLALAKTTPLNVSRIEVANGNGVTGMAKRISSVLGRYGINVSRLSNELPYKQLETKIQYRAGYEKTATGLKNALKGHAVVVLTPSLSLNADVRLVLGKDAITHMAMIESLSNETLLALNAQVD